MFVVNLGDARRNMSERLLDIAPHPSPANTRTSSCAVPRPGCEKFGGGGVTIALRPGLPQDSRDPSPPSRDLWTYCCVEPITWKVPIVAFRDYSNGDGF